MFYNLAGLKPATTKDEFLAPRKYFENNWNKRWGWKKLACHHLHLWKK